MRTYLFVTKQAMLWAGRRAHGGWWEWGCEAVKPIRDQDFSELNLRHGTRPAKRGFSTYARGKAGEVNF